MRTPLGEIKMPLPMMMPTMTLTALKRPRDCLSPTLLCRMVAEVAESNETVRSLFGDSRSQIRGLESVVVGLDGSAEVFRDLAMIRAVDTMVEGSTRSQFV